jgi:hypothetical protein
MRYLRDVLDGNIVLVPHAFLFSEAIAHSYSKKGIPLWKRLDLLL